MVGYYEIVDGRWEFIMCPMHQALAFAKRPGVEFACVLRGGREPGVGQILAGDFMHPARIQAAQFAQENM